MEVWAAVEILGRQISIRIRLEAESVPKTQALPAFDIRIVGRFRGQVQKIGLFSGVNDLAPKTQWLPLSPQIRKN